jgi:hypothetical protein
MIRRAILALAAALFFLPAKAEAMLASDFLDKLTDVQRSAYLEGALEMLATAQGSPCGYDWYYRGPGPQQLAAVLTKHRDLPVAAVLQALVKKQCLAQ